VEPESEYGRYLAKDVRPFADIEATPCLILLGEPGIGKTRALEEIAASESEHFQIIKEDLGEYSSDDRLFRHVFEREDILAWSSGTHTLSLILDSLDECRVVGISKVLSRQLGHMPIERLRLRLACRTAQWPITLEDDLRSAWGKENHGVYELAPLTKANVAEAAMKSELHADEFLSEIARVRAQPLAIRPVSLKLLLNQFHKKKRLPKDERSLYIEGCRCLCEESPERQDAGLPHVCDSGHRFAVAQRIAYLTIFSGKYAVWTGVQDGSMPEDDLPLSSLQGPDVFNGCDFEVAEEVLRDTLNTGLFTSRGVHRMGWAHQTYAEFLAAQYVLSHLDEKQRRSLLLLTDTVGADVVPQLSEVAARVATSDSSLFEEKFNYFFESH
jgi:predicted NACHT family NTPase